MSRYVTRVSCNCVRLQSFKFQATIRDIPHCRTKKSSKSPRADPKGHIVFDYIASNKTSGVKIGYSGFWDSTP